MQQADNMQSALTTKMDYKAVRTEQRQVLAAEIERNRKRRGASTPKKGATRKVGASPWCSLLRGRRR